MLSEESQKKVRRQVATFTEAFRQTKSVGYNVGALSLPGFDSQEDFDLCRPEEAGNDYRSHNEFVAAIQDGLMKNGVPARMVIFHYGALKAWLHGRPISQETRSGYAAHLLAQIEKAKKEDQGT